LVRRFDAQALSPLAEDRTRHFVLKRALDVVVAAAALVLALPLAGLIALLIYLDSPGPILFTQKRVGANRWTRDGFSYWRQSTFTFYKFRTMVPNADPAKHRAFIQAFAQGRAPESGGTGTRFKLTNDPRVTRFGRILRRTSLDELPQLVNVLKGEMSLVGPRPVPPYEVAEYRPWQRERLAALPGLTGLWQVKGRSQVSFEEMIRMDIDYVRTQSLWLDLKILFWTIPAVLSARGAE
jgi:lipopolysaccharide/colanic/teichoic acid biosynthesis glycosyltransferase